MNITKLKLPALSGAFAALTALCLMAGAATAQQNWPNRPIEVVVPFAPGGSIDITMRSIAPSLSKRLGQQVLIVNKPGGGGTIGMNQVAKSAPDGYTLGAASFSFAANMFVLDNVPYSPLKDFEPITMVSRSYMVLLVNPNTPPKTVSEFIAWVKENPGKLYYTSAGVGSSGHLFAEYFLEKVGGLQMSHVPFTTGGRGPLAQGQVHFMIAPIPTDIGWVKDGRLRALGVTSPDTDPAVPELPTVNKVVPGFEVFEWPGLVAPAGTPRQIVDKIRTAVVETLEEPEVKARLATLGARPSGSTPEEFRAHIEQQMKIWAEVMAHIKQQRETK